MSTENADGQELGEQQKELLRQLPGFRLAEGRPCTCGKDALTTSKKRGYSDSLIFTHRCSECGNRFKTWIEG